MPEKINSSNNQNQDRILKNTGYLTFAFIIQKVLSFLFYIYIARKIGPSDLGLYDPIRSLIPIFLIMIDFSLSAVLVREIARKPEDTGRFLANVLAIKSIFAFVVILAMGLFTNFSSYDPIIKTILYLDALIVVLDTFTLTFYAVFRGHQNMRYEALGMVGTQIMTIIVGVIGLEAGWGGEGNLTILFVAVVAGSIFNFIFSFYLLRKKLGIQLRLFWEWPLIKLFLKIALPFAITALLVKAYTYTDRYLLLIFENEDHVGWYVPAHKLTYALEFIPSAFAASIYPAMSALYYSNREQLRKTLIKAMSYLSMLSIPISVGAFLLAGPAILTIFDEAYETSIEPFQILIVGLLVVFLNFPIGAFLNACNRQVINTINMGITVLVNASLNVYFIVIQGYSFNGAAASALVSGIVLFFLGLRYVGKIIPLSKRELTVPMLKAAVSSIVMGVLLWLLRDQLSIFVLAPIAAIVYIAVLYAVRGITRQDFVLILNAIRRKMS